MSIIKEPITYPQPDEHRRHYVHWPIQLDNGKWLAVNVVLPSGFQTPDEDLLIIRKQFETDEECQKACDIHNNYHFGKTLTKRIMMSSMGKARKPIQFVEPTN